MQLPPNRQQNVLLGIFILYRGRLNFNAPPPVPLPSVIPPSIFSSLTPLAPPPPPPSQPLPNSADLAKAIASLTPEQLELVTKLGLGGSIPSLAGLPPTNPFLSTQPLSYSNVVPPFPLPQNSPPQPLLGYQAQPPASYQSSPPRRDSNQGL